MNLLLICVPNSTFNLFAVSFLNIINRSTVETRTGFPSLEFFFFHQVKLYLNQVTVRGTVRKHLNLVTK